MRILSGLVLTMVATFCCGDTYSPKSATRSATKPSIGEKITLYERLLRTNANCDSAFETFVRATATPAGTALNLTAKEFLLLAHLVRSAGQVVSRGEIAEQVWGINFATNTNVVDVMVRRLRAKVDDPFERKLIHTVRGAGYVLKTG